MNQQRHAKCHEYQKAAQLLTELLELDSNTDTERELSEYVQNYGIGHFFNNLEAFDFSPATLEKLQTIKLILFRFVSDVSDVSEKREMEPYDDGGVE